MKSQQIRQSQIKLRNPYKPDEVLQQAILLSGELQYDYSQSEWIAVDAEFLGLHSYRDSLCCIQIASMDPEDDTRQRVEIVYVYGNEQNVNQNQRLRELFTSDILKIFHVFSSDIVMISRFLGVNLAGPFFDTKVAAKIAWTNSNKASKTEIIKNFIDPKYQGLELGSALWEKPIDKWTEKMISYSAEDVLYLNAMKTRLTEIAKNRGRKEILDSSMKAIEKLVPLYVGGFNVDVFKF